MSEWKNQGDVNFYDYGGTMVRQNNEDYPNDYEFFRLLVDESDDKKYAFHGTVCGLNDYADNEVLQQTAEDCGYENAKELIEKSPETAVAALVEEWGYGAMEFSARNANGQGQYSTNYADFEVNEQQLVDFMRKADLPESMIPDLQYTVTAKYGKDGIEDTFQTNDWEKVETYSHEKLMDGLEIEIKDNESGAVANVDPDKYQQTFEGEFPVDSNTLDVDYGELDDLEM